MCGLGCLACPEMHAALRRSAAITRIHWGILDLARQLAVRSMGLELDDRPELG